MGWRHAERLAASGVVLVGSRTRRGAAASSVEQGGIQMDKDRIEGNVKKATGSVKEAVGKATGDRETEAKGKLEKTAGRVQNTYGKAKDELRK
jgi:uncharacterized protein YjbJ (UPF0337 family)